MSPYWIGIIIAACVIGVIAVKGFYRRWKEATPEERPAMIKIFIAVGVISIGLFVGIHFMTNTPVEDTPTSLDEVLDR